MGTTYAEQLNNKKVQLEEVLKMEMDLVEIARENIKNMTDKGEIPVIIEPFKRDVAHRELVIEALQDAIEKIDTELRKDFTD